MTLFLLVLEEKPKTITVNKQIINKILFYTLGTVGIFLLCLILLTIWHISSMTRQYIDISLAEVSSCRFETGDIILFQHVKYKHSWFGLEGIMSHMGAVLMDEVHGPLCIDFNPTLRGAFESIDEIKPVLSIGNLQLLKLKEVVQYYPGVVLVRPLLKPMTEEQKQQFKTTILTKLSKLDYSPDVIRKSLFFYLPLTFSTLIPELSSFFATYFSSLVSTRMSTFCTEGVALAFQDCGLLHRDHGIHIQGPISWMHGMIPEYTLVWGKEILLF